MQASAIKKCIYEKKAYQPAVITTTPPSLSPHVMLFLLH